MPPCCFFFSDFPGQLGGLALPTAVPSIQCSVDCGGVGEAIHRSLSQNRRNTYCSSSTSSQEGGAPAGELGEGVAGEGGWWGERPSARAPAAGVVEGGGGLMI